MSTWRRRSAGYSRWYRRRVRRHPRGFRDRRASRYHRPRSLSPNSRQRRPSARIRHGSSSNNPTSAPRASRSSARSAVTAGASSASSRGPCLNAGCATTSTCARRTPSSTTLHVYVASKGYSTTARRRTEAPRAPTTPARAPPIDGRRAGAVWRPSPASCPVCGFTCRCSALRRRSSRVTRGTRGKGVGVALNSNSNSCTSPRPRNVSSTQGRTSKGPPCINLFM